MCLCTSAKTLSQADRFPLLAKGAVLYAKCKRTQISKQGHEMIATSRSASAIYEITNKDHFPLWMPENTFDLGVVELVHESMQSVSMTMNVTAEIVSLDRH